MTITPPTVQPVTVAPPETIFRGATDVQPFTYRSGMTYTQILESIRVWLRNTLVPYLNTNFEDLAGSWLENVTAIDTAVNLALSQQADAINTALTVQQQQVADELATTLNEITQGESAALNDAAVHNALLVAGSTSLALLDGRYHIPDGVTKLAALRLEGTGIDPTGATASDAAVQAIINNAPAGASLVVPEGSIIGLSTGLTVGKRLRITGGGELRYIGTNPATLLHATVDGVQFDGLYLTNPNGRLLVTGIVVEANVARVTACRLDGMGDGIQVAPTGEWHDIVISNNEVLNVIGSGTGPVNGDWNSGESNGDGIVSWGAAVVITGNRVSAKAGKDARIGIHVENLNDRETISYENADALAVISGNVVTGPFRRAITTEGVQHAAITGNVVAGPTFWGINVVGLAHHSVVSGNTIKMTQGRVNPTGSVHAGIFLYCIQEALTDVIVSNNIIRTTTTGYLDIGIVVNFDPSVSSLSCKRLKFIGNTIEDESNTMGDGIHISAASEAVEVTENRIYRAGLVGVYMSAPTRPVISNNRLYGRGGTPGAFGVQIDGAFEATVDNNVIRDVDTAVHAYVQNDWMSASNNRIRNAATGMTFYNPQAGLILMVQNNLLKNVGTPWNSVPAGVFSSGNNV